MSMAFEKIEFCKLPINNLQLLNTKSLFIIKNCKLPLFDFQKIIAD